MNPRAKTVNYKTPYHLVVFFTNEETKVFDLWPYLKYPIYEKLQDETYCSRVKVNNGVLMWDEETDIDPDRLYLESRQLMAADFTNKD